MNNLKKIVIGIFLVISSFGVFGQPYMVYKDAGSYVCIDAVKKELKRGDSASEVIQHAVNLCEQSGSGEVVLGKGFFKLENSVKISGKVWIHGKRRGTELQLKSPNTICFEVMGSTGARITEMSFTRGDNWNSVSGISVKDSKNCQINDAIFLGFAQSGISLKGDTYGIKVDRCTFVDNGQAHILMKEVTGNKEQLIVISNGIFLRGSCGILTQKGNVQSQGLEAKNNAFAYLRGITIDTDFDYAIITGNRVYWGESDGMRVRGKGLYFSGNTNSWIRGHGLVLDGAKDGKVIGNNITDLGARYRDGMRKCGIYLCNAKGMIVSGNSIWNFGDQGQMEYAVYEASNCKNNAITFNTGWFHAYPDGFKSLGEGSMVENNSSSEGKYRGDYWDPTQKYGYPIEKYIKSLYLDGNYSLETVADPNASIPQGKQLIESKSLLGVVVSKMDGVVKQFGWNGDDSQVWELKAAKNGYFTILNSGTGELLQAKGTAVNAPVGIIKSEKKGSEDAQLWKPVSVGNGFFKLENKLSGKVLTAPFIGNFDWGVNKVVYRGQELSVSDYTGGEGQIWRFTDLVPAYSYEKTSQQ